jgi:hypothetical protein
MVRAPLHHGRAVCQQAVDGYRRLKESLHPQRVLLTNARKSHRVVVAVGAKRRQIVVQQRASRSLAAERSINTNGVSASCSGQRLSERGRHVGGGGGGGGSDGSGGGGGVVCGRSTCLSRQRFVVKVIGQ